MKIVLFSLIVVLAAVNIFCSVLYSKLIKRLPGQITGRITLKKLSNAFEYTTNEDDKNLIKKCKYAYTIYLVFFYVFIAMVTIFIVSILKQR